MRLLKKANELPLQPGVYLMRDKVGKIIYVGKSRKLKNRVTSYFRAGEKSAKTARMVSQVADFDYYLCDTEIEALSLENTLIKQHTPRYNIRLKDAKSYPYIKITAEAYPRLVFTRSRKNDKGRYFGPYSGASVAGTVIRTLEKTLGLPSCKRRFPQDIGKERPCLYYQLGQCCGVCTGKVEEADYAERIKLATDILRGNSAAVRRTVREDMLRAAEAEEFEKAAALRDTLAALEKLSQKQRVVASPDTEEDVIGVCFTDLFLAVSIFYVREGALVDKTEEVFSVAEVLNFEETLAAFLYEHYKGRTDYPARILLSYEASEEHRELLSAALSDMAGRKVQVYTPERGELRTLALLAAKNAEERAAEAKRTEGARSETMVRLAELLALEVVPSRIESYDISNFGSEHKTCGMIVWENGSFRRRDYRTFRIREVEGTDDYASMREALSRRFSHLDDQDGAFSVMPDLILIDGGMTHVAAARDVAREHGIPVPIFGMVKDAFHKTRALCTDKEEISIALDRGIFTTIYQVQEEVHRFSVRSMSDAKRRTLRSSSLQDIKGLGKEKARSLLSHFGGLAAVKRASVKELQGAAGIGPALANTIYEHFHKEKEEGTP